MGFSQRVGLLMLLCCVVADASLAAGSPFDFDDILGESSLIVWGDVVDVYSCYQEDDGTAWTFVELNLLDTLAGTPLAANGSALGSGTFTFRVPGGPLPDNQFLYHGGTPMLFEGDEIIAFLTYDEAGEPLVDPFAFDGRSVYRVVPRPNQQGTSVVSADGFPLFESFGAFPRTRARIVGGTSNQLGADTVDTISMGEQADALEGPVPSLTIPWRGGIRVKVEETGGEQRTAWCDAPLDGTSSMGTVALYGRCTLDYVGAVELGVDASWNGSGWSGLVYGSSVRWDDYEAELPLVVESRSDGNVIYARYDGNEDDVDGNVASLITQADAEFTWDITLWSVNSGPTPLMSDGTFRSWIDARLTDRFSGLGEEIRSLTGNECPTGPRRAVSGGEE